jgi:hypothetical protein
MEARDIALDSGAPPSVARLPMTPEEVAASYDAKEAGRSLGRPGLPTWLISPRRAEARTSSQLGRGYCDLARPDTLPEPFAQLGAELAPFVPCRHPCQDGCAGLGGKARRERRST